jgi:hypothetical protein
VKTPSIPANLQHIFHLVCQYGLLEINYYYLFCNVEINKSCIRILTEIYKENKICEYLLVPESLSTDGTSVHVTGGSTV